VTFDLELLHVYIRFMTIVLIGLKVNVKRSMLGSQFETWSVGPRSSIEDSFLVNTDIRPTQENIESSSSVLHGEYDDNE